MDSWLAHGPSIHALIETFLYRAIARRLVKPLEVPQRSLANQQSFGHDQRLDAIRRVLLSDEILLNLRIAGGLVLLFAQPLNRIASMKMDQIRVDGDLGRVSNTRSVREWAEGSRAPGANVVHRLRTAYYAAGILIERESAKTIQAWFQGMNPELGDQSPAALLRVEPLDDVGPKVIAAARSFAAHG